VNTALKVPVGMSLLLIYPRRHTKRGHSLTMMMVVSSVYRIWISFYSWWLYEDPFVWFVTISNVVGATLPCG
jgi:hypothetical protein